MSQSAFPRSLPATTVDTQTFWTAGQTGQLMIHRCDACAYYVHPPVPFCPKCESTAVHPHPVSGRGRIASFTINHKQWFPELPVPYVLALVAIEEQDDVRLVSNIIDCEPDSVRIDMPVTVTFEQVEDLWAPLFRPEDEQ